MRKSNPKKITSLQREEKLGQKGTILWITGLSGSGKSTLAAELEQRLFARNALVYVLDGDLIRTGLNSDLGFSAEDREENIRRIGEVARLFADAGFVVIVAFISPFRQDRDRVRSSVRPEQFIEIHLDCPLEVCEKRDPKGLYKKARRNEIKEFTGITSPYEKPLSPEIRLNTNLDTIKEDTNKVIDYLEQAKIFRPEGP